jgi:uncharacterized protein (TIGR02145 family)
VYNDTISTGRYGENWWYYNFISNTQIDSLKAKRTAYYGKWYNYYAVTDPRGICPTGWRIPNKADWDTLAEFLGNDMVAGDKMKTIGSAPSISFYAENWHSGNQGTNQSGFSAVPGGNSLYPFPGQYATWYFTSSPTYNSGGFASINYSISLIGVSAPLDGLDPTIGASVRCIKD